MNKLLGIIAFSLVASYSFAQQKRPLDIDACSKWMRVDNAKLSPTGRYVTYKIVPIDPESNADVVNSTILYDSKNPSKRVELGDMLNVFFFNQDKNLYFSLADSTGTERTYIYDLPSCKKTVWQHPEPFEPVKGTNFAASRLFVPENKEKNIKSHNNLIIRNLSNKDSVCVKNTLSFSFYNNGRNVIFLQDVEEDCHIKYGPIMGPYKTLCKAQKNSMAKFFSFDKKTLSGKFNVKDSIYCTFDLAQRTVDTLFVVSEVSVPKNLRIVKRSLMLNPNYVMLELTDVNTPMPKRIKETRKKDDSFELELWTWDEMEVPTLQTARSMVTPSYEKYIYNRTTHQLVKVAPAEGKLILPFRKMEDFNYVLYMDETPYEKEKEWREKQPYDLYLVDIRTGANQLLGKEYIDRPKWSPTGRWALVYDPVKQNWNKFDSETGEVTNASADIPYPIYSEKHDQPAPAPAYGISGWSADGKSVYIMDAYDWWKVSLDGAHKTTCLTRGNGRKNQISYQILYSNIDKNIFEANDKIDVLAIHTKDMSQSICQLDMKGNVTTLMHGDYMYQIKNFSDNRGYCLWMRQNDRTFPDIFLSTAKFKNIRQVTDCNPQQKDYLWGDVKLIEWKNYEGKQNRGLLYLPDNYDSKKTYPVLVQFYETHTEEKNKYPMPMLSNAMVNIMYAVSNGYIVFMPDVHFTVGNPGQSTYDAVVSGTNWLIEQGYAKKGMIGLQGHSWSGFQTTYLVTKTNLFDCVQIGAPITDMITGYLGIRSGSGLPRYFMYEETQSRMGATLWDAKDKYRAMSPIVDADKINTPVLIFHNDKDEAVPYEHGRALFLALRRLHKPAWMVNYKEEGHFLDSHAAQKDWTIRQMQFFDYYLKGTKEPRWMKEGIQLKDRGYDQKYDLVK